jgi:hypothetical protein
MNKNLATLLIYNAIGVTGIVLSIYFWPANFFIADRLLHWVLPFALVLSFGFMLVGCGFYSKGKGYSPMFGLLAIIGPLGWAILLTMKHNQADPVDA